MSRRLTLKVVAAGLAAALVVSGCAPGDEGESESVDVETTEESTLSAEATESAEGTGTTLEVTVGEEEVERFNESAREAGLFEAMRGMGPYTVLAPTDEAFDQLGEDRINELLERENRDELARLVSFHVIPGRWSIDDLRAVESVPTLSGRFLPVAAAEGEGVEIGGVVLTEARRETEDGIVYVIDTVLDPDTGSETPQRSGETTP